VSKKKILRERMNSAEKKHSLLTAARNGLRSGGMTMILAGLALAPAATILPWLGGLCYIVEAAAVALPIFGAGKVVRDVLIPAVEKVRDEAEEEAFGTKVLLLTANEDGEGLGRASREVEVDTGTTFCDPEHLGPPAQNWGSSKE